jgi:hypothetical protein
VSSRTYVCFDCRTTERVAAPRIAKRCRKCRRAAHHVYYKFKIPARADDRGWSALESQVRPMNLETQVRMLAQLRGKRRRLERILATVPVTNPSRQKLLRSQLRAIEAESKEWLQWSAA